MDFQNIEKLTEIKLNFADKYMSPQHLAYFESVLIAWKNAITEHDKNAKSQLRQDTEPMADISDRASLEEEFALTLRSRDRERKLIAKINAALARIANEEFGYCNKCGIEIGLKRLQARPTAELCIDCKQIEEKREKTYT
ncbi:MAG: RNA polymerase-binding protein DksA [Gammaproteobacteria bacterium]|nr:MAG: RNA polymerase-binding protein DksA [Gammaproteobacteria bacterium]